MTEQLNSREGRKDGSKTVTGFGDAAGDIDADARLQLNDKQYKQSCESHFVSQWSEHNNCLIGAVALELGRISSQVDILPHIHDYLFKELEKRAEAEAALMAKVDGLESAVTHKDLEINQLREKNDHLQALLNFRDSETEEFQYKLDQAYNDIGYLMQRTEQLKKGITILFNSKRWKIGDLIGEWRRRILLQPSTPLPADYVEQTLSDYKKWKKKK